MFSKEFWRQFIIAMQRPHRPPTVTLAINGPALQTTDTFQVGDQLMLVDSAGVQLDIRVVSIQ